MMLFQMWNGLMPLATLLAAPLLGLLRRQRRHSLLQLSRVTEEAAPLVMQGAEAPPRPVLARRRLQHQLSSCLQVQSTRGMHVARLVKGWQRERVTVSGLAEHRAPSRAAANVMTHFAWPRILPNLNRSFTTRAWLPRQYAGEKLGRHHQH